MPLFGDVFTDVGQDYILTKKLGSGNFAKVVLGELKRLSSGRIEGSKKVC